MESLSAVVLVWLGGLFLLVMAWIYARTFAGNPRWFTWTILAVLVVLCVPIVLASLGTDAVLVWVVLAVGLAGLVGALCALARTVRLRREHPDGVRADSVRGERQPK